MSIWGSISCSRTLWHAAQLSLELGLEPATFLSQADLLYPLSYSHPVMGLFPYLFSGMGAFNLNAWLIDFTFRFYKAYSSKPCLHFNCLCFCSNCMLTLKLLLAQISGAEPWTLHSGISVNLNGRCSIDQSKNLLLTCCGCNSKH